MMKRKILAGLLAFALVMTLSACGGDSGVEGEIFTPDGGLPAVEQEETATGKVNVDRSGSSGATSHSGEVYAFLQGQALVSQTWSEEYDYEEDVWKITENGVTSYYTSQEWEAMNSGEDAPPQPERDLPWRSFEEVVADACSPVEMMAYLNDYIAALSGKESATIFVSEITDEQRMAEDYYNLMAELEETGSLSCWETRSSPERTSGWTMPGCLTWTRTACRS